MDNELSPEEHKQRHIELHKSLDELIADFIMQTDKLPLRTPIIELMEWSYQQTQLPTNVDDPLT